jgi:branched-chain amino acid transport system permease protein
MHELGEQLVNGVVDGCTYAALGLSLVVILKITRIGNFAQGSQALVAVYIVWSLWRAGVPLVLAIVLSTLISFALGAALYVLIVRRVDGPGISPYAPVILTLGLLSLLQYGAQAIWGADALTFPAVFGQQTVHIGGVATTRQALGTIGVLVALCVLLYFFIERSRLGTGLRAVAENRLAAAAVGIPVLSILALGWGIAAALGAICGAMVAPTLILQPQMMTTVLIYAFSGAVLGGMTSLVGAVVGCVLLGLIDDILAAYVPAIGASYSLIVAFVVIVLVLLVRPQGLLGTRELVAR